MMRKKEVQFDNLKVVGKTDSNNSIIFKGYTQIAPEPKPSTQSILKNKNKPSSRDSSKLRVRSRESSKG